MRYTTLRPRASIERFKTFTADMFLGWIFKEAATKRVITASSSCCPGGHTISTSLVICNGRVFIPDWCKGKKNHRPSLYSKTHHCEAKAPSKSPPKGET